MSRWSTNQTGRGSVIQGAIPTGQPLVRASGLTLRGVVVASYVYDSGPLPNQSTEPNDIYVDVLVYGQVNTVLPRVLWTQGRSGLHEGDISLPRAATLDTSGEPLDVTKSKPQALDGDHVVVGFLEDDLGQPYVVTCLNHPSSDIGRAGAPLGQRMRLTSADGHPRLTKHRGSALGIDTNGNAVLDTRQAHSGEYQGDGSEPLPTNNGSNGNTIVDLQEGATITIRIGDGAAIVIQNRDGNAEMTLGDGARGVALAENLQNYINNQVKLLFDQHTHPYAFGPTGPPMQQFPEYDTSITSTKSRLPDG